MFQILDILFFYIDKLLSFLEIFKSDNCLPTDMIQIQLLTLVSCPNLFFFKDFQFPVQHVSSLEAMRPF